MVAIYKRDSDAEEAAEWNDTKTIIASVVAGMLCISLLGAMFYYLDQRSKRRTAMLLRSDSPDSLDDLRR